MDIALRSELDSSMKILPKAKVVNVDSLNYEVEKIFKKIYSNRKGYTINKGNNVFWFVFSGSAKKDINQIITPIILKLVKDRAHNNRASVRKLEKRIFKTIYPVVTRVVDKTLWYVDEHSVREDCVQEALIKFYNNLDRYSEDKGKALTWLYTIVINVCRDFCRKKSFRQDSETGPLDEHYELSDEGSPEEDFMKAHDKERIHNALQELDEDERQIVIMTYYDGLTLREIGEKMGKPHTTIRNYLNKALTRLKKILDLTEN